MRLDKLTLLPLLAAGFALGLTACGSDDGGTDDTGWTDTDTDTDSDTATDTDTDTDTDADYFDTYAVFWGWETAFDGSDLVSWYYEGTEVPPVVDITFAEEDYFVGYDERYACHWYGVIVPNGLDDLEMGDNLWIGWDVSFQFLETDCDDFDPELWGDDTPTAVIEDYPFGIGWGAASAEMEADLKGAGVSEADWAVDWEPYVYSGYIAYLDTSIGGLYGIEVDIAFSYETSEAMEPEVDADGYLIAKELPADGSAPTGFNRTLSFQGYDAVGWYLQ